jgi:hypothetical protein
MGNQGQFIHKSPVIYVSKLAKLVFFFEGKRKPFFLGQQNNKTRVATQKVFGGFWHCTSVGDGSLN